MQYLSSSTIREIPRTWPSTRFNRLRRSSLLPSYPFTPRVYPLGVSNSMVSFLFPLGERGRRLCSAHKLTCAARRRIGTGLPDPSGVFKGLTARAMRAYLSWFTKGFHS